MVLPWLRSGFPQVRRTQLVTERLQRFRCPPQVRAGILARLHSCQHVRSRFVRILPSPVARLRGAGVDVRGALTRQDPGSGPWHLDDRELLQAVKTQCPLDELALAIRDLISGDDFHLVEPNLAGFPPGEYVEEAVERSAVFGAQAVEDPNSPLRGSGLGDSRDSGSQIG